eukprot:c16766_g1_i1 orf=160-732(-)
MKKAYPGGVMARLDDGAAAEAQAAAAPPPPSLPSSSSSLEPFEESLRFIDFKMERMDADCVEGRFTVSEKSCQPFGVLHGGVSALIGEALASTGAFLASGHRRVAGVQLTINHLKAAPIGTEVFASAKPVHVGRRLHVWDVLLSKVDDSGAPAAEVSQGTSIGQARVILMVDPSGPVVKLDQQGKPHARL